MAWRVQQARLCARQGAYALYIGCAHVTWRWAHDRKGSVTTEEFLSRQELLDFMSRSQPLCCDMVLRLQWATGSWQKCCVTIEFQGKVGGLGCDKDSSVAAETC